MWGIRRPKAVCDCQLHGVIYKLHTCDQSSHILTINFTSIGGFACVSVFIFHFLKLRYFVEKTYEIHYLHLQSLA